PLFLVELLIVLIPLPRIVGTAWDSGQLLMTGATDAFGSGHTLDGVTNVLQVIVLVIPGAGILLMLVKGGSTSLRSGWQRTEDRPVLRTGFVAATVVAAGLL